MLQSNQIQEQMRNKMLTCNSLKRVIKPLGRQRTTVRAFIHKWRKLVTVVNLPGSVWLTKMKIFALYKNDSKSAMPTHPGGRNQEQHLKKLQASLASI